jgi:toxin ParE1/3/4
LRLWPVVFDPDAEFDLDEIHDWIANRTSERVAEGYTRRILNFCQRLRNFPERGVVRPDVFPGARIVGFEHSASVVFVIDDKEVRILRILYAGRQFESG